MLTILVLLLAITPLINGTELTLTITEGNSTTFNFDFCTVVSCLDAIYAQQLMTADKYMCVSITYQHDPSWVCRRWD